MTKGDHFGQRSRDGRVGVCHKYCHSDRTVSSNRYGTTKNTKMFCENASKIRPFRAACNARVSPHPGQYSRVNWYR